MRFQDIRIGTPTPTPTPMPTADPAPAPPPGPAPEVGSPAPPPAPEAPRGTLPLGVPLPAGMEAAERLALAELAELPAAGPWGELPLPFALVWLCGKRAVFHTWHTVTYSHLRRQSVTVLHPTEWDALCVGALNDRGSHIIAQWVERKVRNPLFEISTDLALGGVVAEPTTKTFTIAQVGKSWGLSLAGCVYGPQ
jgi:hypothetical protein